jgi:hypothetical protein
MIAVVVIVAFFVAAGLWQKADVTQQPVAMNMIHDFFMSSSPARGGSSVGHLNNFSQLRS